MNDVIENVLNDETYASNEERVEAIKKGLATLVIPKDKYNDLSTRLKTTESNLSLLQTEYDDFKKSKMTDDEKIAAEREEFENQKKANLVTKSELAVKGLLLDNGIKVSEEDEELQKTLKNIISDDYNKSLELANSFISLLNKTKETTVKETTTQLLNDTPKPIGGVESSSTVSKMDQLNNELKKAIENKDVVKQTQLMTQIFQEQNKPNI